MRCARCGDTNPDGAQFCRICGNPLAAVYYQYPPAAYYQTPEDNGIATALVWIIVAVALLIVIGVVVFWIFWSSLLDNLGLQLADSRLPVALMALALA